jgi:uncharacterized membrane protein
MYNQVLMRSYTGRSDSMFVMFQDAVKRWSKIKNQKAWSSKMLRAIPGSGTGVI